ncbi:MAG: 2TM domain-containing protein [Methanobrevibacter sp.]|jgi:hypothetical protein|nr:2TM domain-containing protein [Candidatus Methanoflexus mossambicus]
MSDIKEIKGKILVKETKNFYFQLIFQVILIVAILIRMIIVRNENIGNGVDSFVTTIVFAVYILIFILLIVLNYLKLWKLRKNFKNKDISEEKLKKYMKSDEIPELADVDSKFALDKEKAKKRFYSIVLRIIILNVLLIYLNMHYGNYFHVSTVLMFISWILLIYRYLSLFHLDKKLFNDEWEKKKLNEYLKDL